MATVELTAENFAEKVGGEGITLVDFWAEWCGPCRAFAPTYEKVSENNPDLIFGKVDTEAQQDLAMEFQIRSIPTLMIVRDGVAVFSQPGMMREQQLESLIKQVRELDMDEVRAQIAEHTAGKHGDAEAAEPAKAEPAEAAAKAEAPQADSDSDSAKAPEAEAPKAETPKPAAPKPAPPKAAAAKAAAPKAAAPKADAEEADAAGTATAKREAKVEESVEA